MTDYAAIIGPVARELWGEPNGRLTKKNEMRWGARGARVVRLDKGTWADNETGESGGVLDMLRMERNLDGPGAHAWLQERGYEEKANGRVNGHDSGSGGGLGKIVATYDYVDESGELIFQVVRFDPKDFRQRRKAKPGEDSRDGWSWSVRGLRWVPYRLPEVIEAIAAGHTVWIVEGEKNVDALWKAGIPATCNPGGAGKWRAELNEFFSDADVVVAQDNDPQAKNPDPPKGDGQLRWHPDGSPVLPGQDHANSVCRHMQGVARSVRGPIDLTRVKPDLPLKGDVYDCLAGGISAEQLHALAGDTPAYRLGPLKSRYGGMFFSDIGTVGLTAAYEWFIEDVIPLGEHVLMFGDSGTGKSFDGFDMAMCGARGLAFNNFNVEPGMVAYVAAEAGKGFGKRKTAYLEHHKLQNADLPFYLMTKRPNFFSSDDDVNGIIEEIKAASALRSEPLRAIFFDTLSAMTSGMNENAGQDISIVRERLERVREAFNCRVAIVLVHHKPKGGGSPRGHGSLTNDFETTIEFETTGQTDNSGRPVHKATVRKQREGKSGLTWSFTLPVVAVGRNKWGNAETSCVVVPFMPGADRAKGFNATFDELLFMRSLFEAMDEHGTAPPPGLPRSIMTAVELERVRQVMRSRRINAGADPKKEDQNFRTAFKRAGDKLREGRVIGVKLPLVWYTGKPVKGLEGPAPPIKRGDSETGDFDFGSSPDDA